MTEDTKAKIDEAKAKGKVALDKVSEKTKSVFSEIKTNFKADEGTSGANKIQSMFANLWKSGTTGKAAMIACPLVAIFMLVCMFSGGGAPSPKEYKQMLQGYYKELDEVSGELCELGNLLKRKAHEMMVWESLVPSSEADREAKIKEEVDAYEKASNDERIAGNLMQKNTLKDLKDELQKMKDECTKKGIDLGESSPYGVAKKLLSLYKEKKFVKAYDECCIKDDVFKMIHSQFEELFSEEAEAKMGKGHDREMFMEARNEVLTKLTAKIVGIEVNASEGEALVVLDVKEKREFLRMKKVDGKWKVGENHDDESDFYSL